MHIAAVRRPGNGHVSARIDLTNRVFGRLTVIAYAGNDRHRNAVWKCICVCGTETTSPGKCLRTGQTNSCGCLSIERTKQFNTTHGATANRTIKPTYKVWIGMKQRCSSQEDSKFRTYAGRGIAVCERWNDFANFLADMGERPHGKTIERLNNYLGYSPDNCVWATPKEQSLNRRDTNRITICGKRKPMQTACQEYGIKYATVYSRRVRHGVPLTQAFLDVLDKKLHPSIYN